MQTTNIPKRSRIILPRNIVFLLIAAFTLTKAQNLTPFEKSGGKASATLKECLSFYRHLEAASGGFLRIEEPDLNNLDIKYHDAGQIKLVRITNPEKKQEKVRIFINNGIHPGEPDGIDASMMLAREMLTNATLKPLLNDIELCIIPVYNTGGSLQRGCCSRANQDGPIEYGFRGNDLNLDLNRDFMKCDALETRVFQSFFHKIKPHIFIDTHVSDGADYQYTMTLIASQHDKYQCRALDEFCQDVFLPMLYYKMQEAGEEMCPYVDFDGEVPDSGITAFFDTPRFSSGYTSMFNCYSFIAETHMLKPFDQRVKATYTLLLQMVRVAVERGAGILNSVHRAGDVAKVSSQVALRWTRDETRYKEITFKGYAAYHGTSAVTGMPQLYYDRSKPYTKQIKYFNTYKVTLPVRVPQAYVMPYEWYRSLKLDMYDLDVSFVNDTSVVATTYTNLHFTNRPRPYEGAFGATVDSMHRDIIRAELKGTWVMITLSKNVRYKRYLVEALEPQSPDGFFAWGKMYSITHQKEGFSDYVWDARAANILDQDPELKKSFQAKKDADPKFSKDREAQLEYIYHHSPYYERTHLRYPVFRIEN